MTTATPSIQAQALAPVLGVKQLVQDSIEMAKQPINVRNWRTWTAALFALSIVGDIVTTQWMMTAGITEEGNSVAAFGMSIMGQTGYIIFASLVMAGMLPLILARPRHYAGWVAQMMVLSILLVKLGVVWNNISLWLSLT